MKKYNEVLLAAGSAVFTGKENAREILKYWQRLANQKGFHVKVPEKLTRSILIDWADKVLDSAIEGEPDWVRAPNARAKCEGSGISFGWKGYFTKGRFLEVTFFEENEGLEPVVLIVWDSGTGESSRFLKVEKLLDLNADFLESKFDSYNNLEERRWRYAVASEQWAGLM